MAVTIEQRNNHAISLRQMEQMRVELLIPTHLMLLMIEEAGKQGFECRSDLIMNLNRSSMLPFTGLDDLSISRVAKRTDDAARSLLHDLSPDDASVALLTIAMLLVNLVDEKLFMDVHNPSVLSALLLIEDSKEYDAVRWETKERDLQSTAGVLLARLRLLGYYMQADVALPGVLRSA